MHYYDERRIRLHSLVKFFKLERDRVRSDLYRKYNENYSRTLTVQLLSKYVDGEDDYIFVNKLLLEVEEVYEEYVSVVDTFKQRHYELTNMTKLRIANLEFSEI
jgi:FMN phosphatase YigB (HAD superfamily)